MTKQPPLPGSPEAAKLGCTCPAIDNRGRPPVWRIVRDGCPLHAAELPSSEQ